MKPGSSESLFGTDGIRSEFGKFPLDPSSIIRIGSSVSACIGSAKVLIGRDPRISGSEIEKLLVSGIGSGSEVFSAGIIPTPALSYNVAAEGFDLGIMITASHNIWSDNGIKLFGPDGEKLPDRVQDNITAMFYSERKFPEADCAGKIHPFSGTENYVNYLAASFPDLRRPQPDILLDCANGAVSDAAPEVYSRLGIPHTPFNIQPDGKNINAGCGSTVPGYLAGRIRAGEGQLGITFDGDGDRVILLDGNGRELDGDFLLFIISRYLKAADPDYFPSVVGTVMSNLSLEKELERAGIAFFRSDVGDRQVVEEMKNRSAVLGGEQSGHIIYRALQQTGDGILTSLLFLRALGFLGLTVSDASAMFTPFPQVTRSIRIREKKPLENWPELNRMIGRFYDAHGVNSRILIRYSGTEKKVRLMIESEDENVLTKNLEVFERFLVSGIGE